MKLFFFSLLMIGLAFGQLKPGNQCKIDLQCGKGVCTDGVCTKGSREVPPPKAPAVKFREQRARNAISKFQRAETKRRTDAEAVEVPVQHKSNLDLVIKRFRLANTRKRVEQAITAAAAKKKSAERRARREQDELNFRQNTRNSKIKFDSREMVGLVTG
mmetsp:Transcript_4579/g.8748  ORF Transcript_4579/g.8748 Transcript_4579/m.8748 type:complete len:159 (-) Transcript_4579:253-729(-)|eukprot:CAMPEP_0175125990 /NCGR_PEP_ID=MMETSP0087-20121206/3607_1 /TAXON_ID=136419 /ORGANISM="Unknown Unknown, Strain D1" /LENGTH=158 /DNA_ID=CAMNT_0016407857 /DNA_START=22 /DNA_END=498 /DNA_ORIENTATION=+